MKEQDISLVKNKSNFVPALPNDQYSSLFLESISNLHETNELQETQKSNISSSEKTALRTLKEDDSIIIKQADKRGATVIMDKTYYKDKILGLLEDRETYIQLAKNEDDQTMKKIRKLTKSHEGELTRKFSSKTSNLYGLPKIHKSLAIKAAIQKQNSSYVRLPPPQDLKFRPIVAGPTSPTHRLSNFIDIILKPLCKNIPSYIRDDLDFLNQIPEQITENTILVSFDVVSLYTSIPHDLGLEAITFWVENYAQSLARKFTTRFIIEAISIILKENTFCFDDTHYKQIQGTAMGTKMAPTYATLVMGYLEKKLYDTYEVKYGENEREEFVKCFKRFLDDCFLPWDKTEAELTQLHEILNGLHNGAQHRKITIP